MIPLDQNIDKDRIIKSLAFGLAATLFGMVFFLFQWAYSEAGQGWLFGFYLVLSIALILPVYFSKKDVLVIILVLMAATLTYSFLKFDWRRAYVSGNETGQAFVLEDYIRDYPTFEDHYFPWFSSSPQWVRFANECYKPALTGDLMGDDCRSLALIESTYGISLRAVIDSYYQKMKSTAQMLQQGQLMNKDQYRTCLEQKRCPVIPLMPATITNPDSDPAAKKIRRQFWSLIEDDKMSPEICDFIDLCRVMRKLNILPIAATDAS